MSKLYLVRHGETDWNRECRYQGSQDIPLNETGRLQAQQAASALSHADFSAIYASALSRAIETADIIRGQRDLEIIKCPSLNEGSFGVCEGKKIDDVRIEYASDIALYEALPVKERLHCKFLPDMESGIEMVTRALPTLQEIAQKHEGENVLVAMHGALIRYLLIHLEIDLSSQLKIENGEIRILSSHELLAKSL